MYHYFPDKRAFFAGVVRTEGERLFERPHRTGVRPEPVRPGAGGRDGLLALRRGTSARRVGGLHGHGPLRPRAARHRDIDNDRQANRLLARLTEAVGGVLDSKVERDLRITIYGWLAFTFELCRQRIIDPLIDADYVADACAHALFDAISRVPAYPDRVGRGGPAWQTD